MMASLRARAELQGASDLPLHTYTHKTASRYHVDPQKPQQRRHEEIQTKRSELGTGQ